MMKRVVSRNGHSNSQPSDGASSLHRKHPPLPSLRSSKPPLPLWSKMILLLLALYLLIAAVLVLYFTEGRFGSHNNTPPVSMLSPSSRVSFGIPYYVDSSFHFDRTLAEEALKTHGAKALRRIMTAYVEPPMNDTIPNTGSFGDPDQERDHGIPPQFVTPLPLRTTTPQDLISYAYPQLQTCHDVPGKIPIDRGLRWDSKAGQEEFWNIGNTPTPDDYPWQEAPYCPVDADPFLPWIHDFFPSIDGTSLHVIGQNKRRCKTGRKFLKDLQQLTPQVSLLQAVSVQRIDENEALELAPSLWYPNDVKSERGSSNDTSTAAPRLPRYRLAPQEEATEDGKWTRFICRFHATDVSSESPTTRVVGETLSIYPFNYELVSYRKGKSTLITPKGKDTHLFWTSNLHFQCPIPKPLQPLVASGETVLSDGTATLWVDIIPIRTPPRYGVRQGYFTEELIGPKATWRFTKSDWPIDDNNTNNVGFDAAKAWGRAHVLPRAEASGRWTNLPICYPPKPTVETTDGKLITSNAKDRHHLALQPEAMAREAKEVVVSSTEQSPATNKPHLLSICLWSSSTFYTRGKRKATTDTRERLMEWITFHLMVGFDHIYLYDNSAAHSNETNLQPIVDLFPARQVTRIDWPSIVCNNNIPAHDNTGERSSQYAAENSCLTRFGPFTEWMASIDADEYLVPMGNYNSMRDVVQDAGNKGYNILSFRSTRGRLRVDSSVEVGQGREKIPEIPFLKAYNCDSSGLPKPEWAERAKKQLYRTDYVLYHFVHYSTVTKGLIKTYKELRDRFQPNYHERSEHIVDEQKEAVMVHTKTTSVIDSMNWINRCHYKFEKKWRGCYVGFPWPHGKQSKRNSHNEDGFDYNCFINEKVETQWLPLLKKALARRRSSLIRGD